MRIVITITFLATNIFSVVMADQTDTSSNVFQNYSDINKSEMIDENKKYQHIKLSDKQTMNDVMEDIDPLNHIAQNTFDEQLKDAVEVPIQINNQTIHNKRNDDIEALINNQQEDNIQRLSLIQESKYQNNLYHSKVTHHPVPSARRSSLFGTRKIFGRKQFHKGLDFAARTGTPVYATGSGRVTISGWLRGYGRVIYINHGNGLQSRYAHNSKLLVKKGQYVKGGQQISKMGCTGRCTGPHLHFEIRQNGRAKNPAKYLRGL